MTTWRIAEDAPIETLQSVFCSTDVEQVRQALQRVGGDVITAIAQSLEEALGGSPEATRTYVSAYRCLGAGLLEEVRDRPEVVCHAEQRNPMEEGRDALWLMVELLGTGSAEAPFSPWTRYCDLADAVALDCASRVRVMIGGPRLDAPVEPITLTGSHNLVVARFLRRVRHHLNHPDDENPLERLMEVFQLNKTELGRLFGVKRQAVDGWLEHGVPGERQEKLATLLALADLLERKLKSGRIPGVARRAADAYGGETMLSLIEQDRHAELLSSVRDAFDWSTAA